MIGTIDLRLLDFCPPTKPIVTKIFWLRAERNVAVNLESKIKNFPNHSIWSCLNVCKCAARAAELEHHTVAVDQHLRIIMSKPIENHTVSNELSTDSKCSVNRMGPKWSLT